MRWRLQLLPCQLWPNIRRDLRDSDISNADTLSDKGLAHAHLTAIAHEFFPACRRR